MLKIIMPVFVSKEKRDVPIIVRKIKKNKTLEHLNEQDLVGSLTPYVDEESF